MTDIFPERAILAAQAACPLPLDPIAELPAGMVRLQSEFALADQTALGCGEGIVVTNLRFCGRSANGWQAYMLRDVAEVSWREPPAPPRRSMFSGLFGRLVEGPPKRPAPARPAGAVDLKLRDGRNVTYTSTAPLLSAQTIAALAKSARSLTG